MKRSGKFVALAVVLTFYLAACNASPPAAGYSVEIDPSEFTSVIDNPYLPLLPGSLRIYEGETEEGFERIEVTVLDETRVVMGVTTIVVLDRAFVDGELVEETYDWFAQDGEGNVWYFGEAVSNFENGVLLNHDGSWEAGVDGALPGIIMFANPGDHLGEEYRQEYFAGEAEDMGTVLNINGTLSLAMGSFSDILETRDWTPLEPGIEERKFYAPGIGLIRESNPDTGETIDLVEFAQSP